jgi:hypothetical protein
MLAGRCGVKAIWAGQGGDFIQIGAFGAFSAGISEKICA